MLGHHEDAAVYFNKGLLMLIQLYGQKNRFKAAMLKYLATRKPGFYHRLMGNLLFSLPRFKVPHAQSAVVVVRYGLHLVHTGEHKLAQIALKLALEIFENVVAENKDYLYKYKSSAISYLALNYWKQGKFESAETLYQESLDLLSKCNRALDWPQSLGLEQGEILQNIGMMYQSSRQYAKALSSFRESKHCFMLSIDDFNHPKLSEVEGQIETATSLLESIQ